MQTVDTNLLPGTLQEMEQHIGIKAVLLLVAKCGGVGLYVPREISADHAIARLIGIDAAEKLASVYGGEELQLPKMLAASIARRNVEIRSEYRTHSQRQLALKYHLTERQIRNIVTGGNGEDDSQMGLF
ncbi:MAG: hypothetical protein JNL77_03150 [Nitrosomonas sp.]|nr:hypothetical protein [Nitrosomonas sp.]